MLYNVFDITKMGTAGMQINAQRLQNSALNIFYKLHTELEKRHILTFTTESVIFLILISPVPRMM